MTLSKSPSTEVTEQLNVLRTKTGRSKQEENNLERLLDLEQELKNFRDELLGSHHSGSRTSTTASR